MRSSQISSRKLWQLLKLQLNRHQDLLDVQCNKQQEFDQAISGAVEQYKVQLNTAQSNLQAWDQEHQLTIKQLQDEISMLEVTSAGQANLPLVAMSGGTRSV